MISMNLNDKKKIAVIGAGYMAEEHIRAFSDIADVVVAGIFSRTRIKAENVANKFSIEHVCDSIDELFVTTQAQLVIIAVPELEVWGVCSNAFKYSWISLIEKPAGYNFVDAQEIAIAAKKFGHTAYVALNRRHYASTRTVLRELKGVDGKRLIHVYDQENPVVALESGTPSEIVKNWMYANSIHVIDYFKTLGRGDITSVEPIIHWDPETPCFVMAKINYSSGDIGIYEAIWNGPGPWAVTVTTQQKRFELRPLEQASVQLYKSRNLEKLQAHPWDSQFKPGLRLQAEEAVKALRHQQTLLPTLDEALESMKLVSSIYEI